jgi:hypothetical protein
MARKRSKLTTTALPQGGMQFAGGSAGVLDPAYREPRQTSLARWFADPQRVAAFSQPLQPRDLTTEVLQRSDDSADRLAGDLRLTLMAAEASARQQLRPQLDLLEQQLAVLLSAEAQPTPEQLDRLSLALNAAAQQTLAGLIEQVQPALTRIAERHGPEAQRIRPRTAQSLLNEISDGDGMSVAERLRRQSPSPLQRSIADLALAAWQRVRDGLSGAEAAARGVVGQVSGWIGGLVSAAAWGAADLQLSAAWAQSASSWRWRCLEGACPVCAPLNGRTATSRSDLPSIPRHPSCRCVCEAVA